jgi:hypothetical protein
MRTRTTITSKALIIFALTIAFSLGITPALAATTPTPTPTTKVSADAEIERERLITKELSLNMPDQTDDPSYPITYIDPSKQGVDITVDEKTIAKAANPFLLPNLAMGEHKLIFKFKNKDGIVRVLSKKILISPKAPVFDATIKTAVVKPASMALSGTALPQATIMIVVNSDTTHSITVSPEGKWEFIVPTPLTGENRIIAFTIKNGIVSVASKPLVISYSLTQTENTNTDTGVKESALISSLRSIVDNIDANRRERPAVFYGILGLAFVAILVLIQLTYRKKVAKKRDEKTIAALFGTLQKDGGSIIDAIKAGPQNKTGEPVAEVKIEAPTKVKKALEALKEELRDEDAAEEVSVESVAPKVVPVEIPKEEKKSLLSFFSKKPTATPVEPVQIVAKIEEVSEKAVETPIKKKGKLKKKAVAHTPEVTLDSAVEVKEQAEEVEIEAEEPEKKVLSKEDFLKQFKKKAEEEE